MGLADVVASAAARRTAVSASATFGDVEVDAAASSADGVGADEGPTLLFRIVIIKGDVGSCRGTITGTGGSATRSRGLST